MTTVLLPTTKPSRTINFAQLLPLAGRPVTGGLMVPSLRSHKVALQRLNGATTPAELQRSRPRAAAKLGQMEARSFAVTKTAGYISRMAGTADLQDAGRSDLRLPYGMPRFVTVATLKKMLKAKRSDLLLKRDGERWEICDDSTRVDLLDDSVEFRMGAVQIFS